VKERKQGILIVSLPLTATEDEDVKPVKQTTMNSDRSEQTKSM